MGSFEWIQHWETMLEKGWRNWLWKCSQLPSTKAFIELQPSEVWVHQVEPACSHKEFQVHHSGNPHPHRLKATEAGKAQLALLDGCWPAWSWSTWSSVPIQILLTVRPRSLHGTLSAQVGSKPYATVRAETAWRSMKRIPQLQDGTLISPYLSRHMISFNRDIRCQVIFTAFSRTNLLLGTGVV